MKLRFKNSRMLAILVAAVFLFSLFPGHGFASDSLEDPLLKIEETSNTPENQPEQGNPDEITTGENPGTPGEDPQQDPGDNPGTPGEDPRQDPGDNPGTPGEGPQEEPGDNPGDNPEGTPVGEQEEQMLLMQQAPVIPEKVTLTINMF